MQKMDGAPAVMLQDGTVLTVPRGSTLFPESFGMVYEYSGEDTNGETVERHYVLNLIICAWDGDGRVLGQYKNGERAVQVFQELRAAFVAGQAYQMPPYEEG